MLADIIGPVTDQPEVRAIAVTSLTGSLTLDGVSGGLGNDLDRELLLALRDWADVVVVGAATVRAEGYTGARAKEVAVVTRSGDVPLPGALHLTPSSPAELMASLRGYRRILVEGGPQIYTMLFDAHLIDILHLTVAPVLVGDVDKHLVNAGQHRLHLEHHAATADGTLFLRYRAVR
ncbi:MAG: dihydrofolate reductase family protein [Corynebacterium sp.]|uniref:dihydrofolate reductase family protein n=1 Tax=Corynebacterium sp. TaxID=1720 RepID=UPI0026E07093|nr:dihydrofolate reductase family protein [Corynebacterium sp.]MDO5670889.1 dihydrofolate reductase family protein [Corynebacterium sp.]